MKHLNNLPEKMYNELCNFADNQPLGLNIIEKDGKKVIAIMPLAEHAEEIIIGVPDLILMLDALNY